MALTSIMGARSSVELPQALAPTPSDAAWLLADVLTQSLEAPHSDGLLELFGQAVPAGEEAAIFDAMSRLPRPGVRAVLTMIGDTHPDKTVTKSARKAAFKAASRHR